nr:hypothetical protein Iba_chr02bCG10550 [Ipomoea batatas]GMC74355.1 hypothetical protein Iba_chr03cCG9450 [Ipomoea batatas]GME11865.1 hypothetical protein Iba_scaffold12767CG0010 [Ipomoea batatas]
MKRNRSLLFRIQSFSKVCIVLKTCCNIILICIGFCPWLSRIKGFKCSKFRFPLPNLRSNCTQIFCPLCPCL